MRLIHAQARQIRRAAGLTPRRAHRVRFVMGLVSKTTGPCRVYFSSTGTGASPFTGIDSLMTFIDSHAPEYLYCDGFAGFVS
jgi:hypothetical protein